MTSRNTIRHLLFKQRCLDCDSSQCAFIILDDEIRHKRLEKVMLLSYVLGSAF